MAISVVCFDLYGTLLDIDGLTDVLRGYTAMPEAMCAEWRKRQLQLTNATTSSGRYVDFDRITLLALLEIAPRFHVKLETGDQKILIDAWAALPSFADAAPALDHVHKCGLPAIVLTNAVASTAHNALAHAGLIDRVDRVISADNVNVYKPNAAVYAQAVGSDDEPGSVLFFSSNDWDAIGARQAGFHSVWVSRRRLTSGPKAERTIVSFDEIDGVLDDFVTR
ncbi:MAG TPA: haloacid dehalogenase type II [Candidatus Lustribacter sp.]